MLSLLCNGKARNFGAVGLSVALTTLAALPGIHAAGNSHPTSAALTPLRAIPQANGAGRVAGPGPREPDASRGSIAGNALARLPLSFELNRGQIDPQVRYLSRGRGYTLFLTSTEAVLALSRGAGATPRADGRMPPGSPDQAQARAVLRMKLLGANTDPQVEGVEQLPGRINYALGPDTARWQQDVPSYSRVHYRDVYPGVDLVYYGRQRELEYDFLVAPGANPSDIRLGFVGAGALVVDRSGELVISTSSGDVRFQRPLIYQERSGRREQVPGEYVVDAENRTAGFRIGAYDPRRPLVIDPVLLYSSYLGGSDSETGTDIALDSVGNIYLTGYTSSVNFPLANAGQSANLGSGDMFVAKLNPAGTALLYSTYFGDGGSDAGMGITVDAAGNAYVTGTYGMPPYWSREVLVAKFSPTGGLIYASVFGTGSDDIGYAIAVDGAGYAYVTGQTGSASDFPTTANAFQRTWGEFEDAFMSVLDPSGATLVYSTYLGGGLNDQGRAIALDAGGNVYVAGGTMADFPTTAGAFQTAGRGFGDAFIVKINPRASGAASLVYSTLLGGDDFEVAHSIAVDAAGNAYVTGSTDSGFDFPATVGAFQTLGGGGNCGTFEVPRHCQDAFVTKLNATGSALIYSTFLGGLGNDFGNGIAVNSAGNAYVVGQAFAADFPVQSAIQPAKAGGNDGFVAKLTPTGNALVYSTYLGGGDDDYVSDIALNTAGAAYVIGTASSTNFPVVSPLQGTNHGDADAFVAKIGDTAACSFSISPMSQSFAAAGGSGSITVTASGAACAWTSTSGVSWVSITAGSGTGSGSATYAVSANSTTTARNGTLTVAGRTFTVSQAAASATIGVTVIAPNGGEKLYAGSPYRIDWTATGPVMRFDVENSMDGGVTFAGVPGCSALGSAVRSCTWTAPGPATANGRIRVTARDAGGAAISDVSNAAFSIVSGTPSITVSSPNSAVNVGIGSLQEVKWSHNLGANAFVRIELSRDGGVTFPEILTPAIKNTAASAGTFAWRVSGPATAGAQARVRVSWTNGSASDVSNVNFTIAPAFITVAAPKAAASWGFTTTQKLTWTTNLGPLDVVNVQLSTAGSGGPFTTLAGGAGIVANKKTANVTVPGTVTTAARIKVVWANAPVGFTAEGLNPGNFRLEAPFVTVTAPAAGQIWKIGSSYNITWAHNLGALETVKIDLSRDGGASYPIAVLASTPSDGSQGVAVQSAWGSQASTRIRITWLKTPGVSSQSSNFTVQP
jgi:hypothetical protein